MMDVRVNATAIRASIIVIVVNVNVIAVKTGIALYIYSVIRYKDSAQ